MEVGIGQRNTATLVGLSLFPDYFYVQSIVLEPCNCVQCYRLYGDVDELPYHQTTVRKRSGGYVVLTTRTCRHTVSLRTVVVVSARALNNCLPFSEPVDKALKRRPIRKLAKSHFCPRGSTGFLGNRSIFPFYPSLVRQRSLFYGWGAAGTAPSRWGIEDRPGISCSCCSRLCWNVDELSDNAYMHSRALSRHHIVPKSRLRKNDLQYTNLYSCIILSL